MKFHFDAKGLVNFAKNTATQISEGAINVAGQVSEKVQEFSAEKKVELTKKYRELSLAQGFEIVGVDAQIKNMEEAGIKGYVLMAEALAKYEAEKLKAVGNEARVTVAATLHDIADAVSTKK